MKYISGALLMETSVKINYSFPVGDLWTYWRSRCFSIFHRCSIGPSTIYFLLMHRCPAFSCMFVGLLSCWRSHSSLTLGSNSWIIWFLFDRQGLSVLHVSQQGFCSLQIIIFSFCDQKRCDLATFVLVQLFLFKVWLLPVFSFNTEIDW